MIRQLICSFAAVLTMAACSRQDDKVAIVAHRGYWNCEEAGFSENSIASLKAAQDHGFWGSEFDVHLTADEQVVVNHDPKIQGIRIRKATLDSLQQLRLPNGEHPASLDEYLAQGEKCASTKLVLEFKGTKDTLRNDILIDRCIDALKAHGLYSPERVMFISFNHYICAKIARIAPGFTNQYLSGNRTPAELSEVGINGIDYNGNVLREHPEYVSQAHSLGMSTNVWTINLSEEFPEYVGMGVQAVTTNEPMALRAFLGKKELRQKAQ